MEKLKSEKVVTFKDYSRLAMRTCTQSSMCVGYMALELVSEVGEVVGKVAKAIRDDDGKITQARASEIAYELGDVMWGLAGLYTIFRKEMPNEVIDRGKYERKENAYTDRLNTTLFNILTIAKDISYMASGFDHFTENSCLDLIELITILAHSLGYSLQEICQMNIDKLTDRYNRNVITGSGDNR